MKYGDVQKLHEAGIITDEQRQKIIGLFQIKEVFVDGKPYAEVMK